PDLAVSAVLLLSLASEYSLHGQPPSQGRWSRLLAPQRYSMQLEAMPYKLEPELPGDALLQLLDILVAELDHVSRFEIDQMIVVLASRLLIAPPPGAELVSLEDPLRLEELQRPVDRRQRNSRVDLIG